MAKITIDIDQQNELLDQVLPWELELRIGGELYPTQRPSVAQVGLLARAEKLSNEEGYALLAGLFDPIRSPPYRTWSLDQIQGALAAYWGYLNERSKKKAKGIIQAVQEAMAATQSPRT